MKLLTAALTAAALSCLTFAQTYAASTVTDSSYVQLTRSGTPLSATTTPKLACPITTKAECEACKAQMILAESTRTSGYVTYKCLDVSQSYVKFAPAPKCTAPKPADEERPGQCPSGTTGAWTQSLTYASAAYPTCWSPGNWTPDAPPAGACVSPPPAQLVYACPEAGSDGRILESSTVVWPNCVGAGYQAPSKSLVAAVNTGALPHYWRDASALTCEKIWTQIGTVGAWTSACTIDWGTVTSPTPGVAKLTWTPSPSPNLAGYRLLYGTSIDALVRSIDTIPVSPTALDINGLAPGPHFFAMQAYTATGSHGPLSAILSVTIR